MKHFLLILSFGIFSLGANAQCAKEPFVLLEIFTSQGCSSCPGIDKWFNGNVTNPNTQSLNLLGLAHHIDYFNGPLPGPCGTTAWVDPFSTPEANATQGEYKTSFQWSGGLFTPQIVIQGKHSSNINMQTGTEGSTMGKALSETPKSGVCIEYLSSDESANTITFKYELIDSDNNGTEELVYYVYEDKLYNIKVTAGENCNLTLDHERVRRKLMKKSIASATDRTGTLTISYPSAAVASNLGVSAFLQNTATRHAVGGTKGFELSNYITTSVNEFDSELFTVTVFPNPASQQVNFELGTGMDYIEIHDLTGKKVQSAYNIVNGFYTMDLKSNVTPGIYIFQVGSRSASIAPKTGKLIIK